MAKEPAERVNLEIISRSGEHPLRLINDVPDISKIGSGRVAFEVVPVDLYQLVQVIRSLMYVRAHDKDLEAGQPRFRLLIAEDQLENRLLLRKFLEPFGFEFKEAEDGQ